MMKSETISELAKALAKAQSEIRDAEKDGENPHFRSSYATLSSVLEAVRGPLTKNGIAFTQSTRINDAGTVILQTTLIHSSGEWIGSEWPIIPTKQDPQGYGSALTYGRRYSLQSITGCSASDDDGNEAIAPPPAQKRVQARTQATVVANPVSNTVIKPVQVQTLSAVPLSPLESQLKALVGRAREELFLHGPDLVSFMERASGKKSSADYTAETITKVNLAIDEQAKKTRESADKFIDRT